MSTYLDHAATTPLRPEARAALLEVLDTALGNPTGAHRAARVARKLVDESRDRMAAALGCAPGEVVFTSGGTESDNLAVAAVRAATDGVPICSAIEHHAVLDPVLAAGGRTVGVDRWGRLDLDDLARTVEPDDEPPVRFVSVMTANNEVGTIQDLEAVGDVLARHAPEAVLHTDAVQAFCWLDLATHGAPAAMISVSAHKFGGPQGVGALVVRDRTPFTAQQLGGGQERDRRSGTHNVAGIVAMAAAAEATVAERSQVVEVVRARRDRLADGLRARIEGLVETAVPDGPDGRPDRSGLIAGSCHVCIEGIESEALLFLLDTEGVAASAASSCASGALDPSHVLAAMGIPRELARGSLRLSLGHHTTDDDVDRAVEIVTRSVERLRGHR